MSEQFILSLQAAPPIDMCETWNRLSTRTEEDIQKLYLLGLKHKQLLLGYEEEITQHCTPHYHHLNPGCINLKSHLDV